MAEATITSADGTKLAARYSGAGSPIVLVHGGLGDLDSFARIEAQLAERHTAWVYSRRGRGGSGDGPNYEFEREVEDVQAVLAATGEQAHLLGISTGALYSLFATLRASSVRSLVLFEPPLKAGLLYPSPMDDVQSALDAGDPDRALELFLPLAGVAPEEMQIMRSLDPVWTSLREGARLAPREIEAIAKVREQLIAFGSTGVPTLYLYGEDTRDAIFLPSDEVAERFPSAQLQGLPGQRHSAPAFEPNAFAQSVLTFTTAHDS